MTLAELIRTGKIPQLLKITVVGTSGSGKTSILRSLFDDSFVLAEVKRRKQEETKANLTYTPVGVGESTTTVSLNQIGATAIYTLNNQFLFLPLNDGLDMVLSSDNIDTFMTFSVFDTAGQDRFDFMVDICIKGSDAVIFVADGTNVASIEYLNYYIRKLKAEEKRTGKNIPAVVFVNKSDLAKKGLFLGADFVRTAISNEYDVYETTVADKDGLILPIRLLIDKLRYR